MSFMYSQNKPNIVICNEKCFQDIQKHVTLLKLFLQQVSYLTESYILDYFVEKLWMRLPASWINILIDFDSKDLEMFLNVDKTQRYKKPWPLSLLAFRASVFALSLSRKPAKNLDCIQTFLKDSFCDIDCENQIKSSWRDLDSAYEDKSGQHKKIPEFCRRHVKPKKQHEIFLMAKLTDAIAQCFDVKNIIDVGSGQGHLSRLLSLCYNLNVSTVEAEQAHVTNASHFDKQAFSSMKYQDSVSNLKKYVVEEKYLPNHLEGCMTVESSKQFLDQICEGSKLQESTFNQMNPDLFLILGLHTCGDLAPTILKLFTSNNCFKILISVGCCYMKLTSDTSAGGYPLSSYVKSISHPLSYEAKEMACHALEMYIQRLKDDAPSLKIHCYRATLEKCIVHHFPDKKHMGLRGVKHAELMPFSEYAKKALSKVSCPIPTEYFSMPEIESCLQKWKEVLVFYSLRLLIAPVIESLILLDRMLFLYEQGHTSCIIPLFDPMLSPRNQVLLSVKRNKIF